MQFGICQREQFAVPEILKRRGAENAEEVSSEVTLRPLRLSVSNSYTACGVPDAYAFLVVAGFLILGHVMATH